MCRQGGRGQWSTAFSHPHLGSKRVKKSLCTDQGQLNATKCIPVNITLTGGPPYNPQTPNLLMEHTAALPLRMELHPNKATVS
jgi:hypothetical protein